MGWMIKPREVHVRNPVLKVHTYTKTLKQVMSRHSCIYVRNLIPFWKVHGIMNTSALLQSNFAREPMYS